MRSAEGVDIDGRLIHKARQLVGDRRAALTDTIATSSSLAAVGGGDGVSPAVKFPISCGLTTAATHVPP